MKPRVTLSENAIWYHWRKRKSSGISSCHRRRLVTLPWQLVYITLIGVITPVAFGNWSSFKLNYLNFLIRQVSYTLKAMRSTYIIFKFPYDQYETLEMERPSIYDSLGSEEFSAVTIGWVTNSSNPSPYCCTKSQSSSHTPQIGNI